MEVTTGPEEPEAASATGGRSVVGCGQRVLILRVGASGMGWQRTEGRERTDRTCPVRGSRGNGQNGRTDISSITCSGSAGFHRWQRSQERDGGKKKARGHHKALPTRTGVWFLVSIDGTSDHFPPLWRWAFYQELYPTALHHQLPREYFV